MSHITVNLIFDDSKLVFSNATLVHGDASPYHVRLQKVHQLRRTRPAEPSLKVWTSDMTVTLSTTIHLNVWTFDVTFTLSTTTQAFQKTLQLMIMCNQAEGSNCKRMASSENIVEIASVATVYNSEHYEKCDSGDGVQFPAMSVLFGAFNYNLWPRSAVGMLC